ncbi:YjcZ family sporulation protein [Candidatus Nitrosocosmicus hydrocola]|uniref:YjcZ family sporulation protein n=1 Tax=Candidatus Nitrosocosmicus hydrocola TaxID=1826872 RepID=UPI000B0C4EBA|nr:YjcZ family sporulation protein [Candidatus Nitrosocosmicus hydrocola]
MKSVILVSSVITLTVILFFGSSGILPKSYASINNILTNDFFDMNRQNLVDKQVDTTQLINAAQYLIDGLNRGIIDDKWLEANGLNTDLLDGVETSQLTEATQHVVDGINNGNIDQQWIEDSLASDNVDSGSGYAGGFILILVLFILLVIIGAGFGVGG